MQPTTDLEHRDGMCRVSLVVLLLVLSGCGYRRGDFAVTAVAEFPPTRMSIGCLDFGVGLDPESTKYVPRIRYGFGNGCDHKIRLDLAALRVEGRDRAGRPVTLQPKDAGWLGVRHLSARWFAREVIAYEPVEDVALGTVCVDLGGVYAEHGGWICLEVRS